MYSSHAFDVHRPIPRIIFDDAPINARWVAPPARIEAPAYDLVKNKRKRVMKNVRVGTVPCEVSHKGDEAGKSQSRVMR